MGSRTAPEAAVQPTPDTPHGGSTPWYEGSLWWDAKSVLVTRAVGPGTIATTPHLVVPAEFGRLAFLLSSYGAEAQQLADDGRVVIQSGDWRGRPALGSRQHYGIARVIGDAQLAARMREGMRIKYGARTTLARMAHRFANGSVPYGDLVALVELLPHQPLMLTR
ncbi:hypothetical protein [Nocardia acidivorans]|uniref:hypothetical protein n=1 Tax=Nocardia acidivorans TaxID=404580 RepID=UPI0012F89714|nr:hypothetical protein [Nocardia acidivorans]